MTSLDSHANSFCLPSSGALYPKLLGLTIFSFFSLSFLCCMQPLMALFGVRGEVCMELTISPINTKIRSFPAHLTKNCWDDYFTARL
jgi:hypothetical protein